MLNVFIIDSFVGGLEKVVKMGRKIGDMRIVLDDEVGGDRDGDSE